MQRINWEMSRDKWVPIVALLEKPGKVHWEELYRLLTKPCGHCEEYTSDCSECTIEDINLCDGHYEDRNGFHYLCDIAKNDIPRNKRRALGIARRILKAILKDEPGGESDV